MRSDLSYKGRQILLVGATGFLGKVLLSMMLHQLPNIGRIYVLVRKNKHHSAIERFIQEVLASPVFSPLHQSHKTLFSQFIADRVKVIEGDTTQPNLGITEETAAQLFSTLDLVIHVAGLVDFFPDITQAFEVNVKGTLNAAQFTSQCQKAALMHISTCYVAGKQNGHVAEQVNVDTAPNGDYFNAEKEFDLLSAQVNAFTEIKSKKREKVAWGQERAVQWGWTNGYVYTKALAESLLTTRYPQLKKTIVRPSIIESAIHFPFSGWNEGLNTTAPFCYILTGWYPYIVAKKEHPLDLIPVDYVSDAVITVGAALLNNQASSVYQIATSQCNPCYLEPLIKVVRAQQRKTATRWIDRHIRSRLPIKFISPNHHFSPEQLSKYFAKLADYFKKFPIRSKIITLSRELKRIHQVYQAYLPFTYDHLYLFDSNEIRKLKDSDDQFDLLKINWADYWSNIHLVGLERWVFSFFRDKEAAQANRLVFSESEKELLLSNCLI